MSAPVTISPLAVSRWWERRPDAAVEADEGAVSAALWNFRFDDPVEIWGEADFQTHIISIHTRHFRHETFYDGKLAHRADAHPGTVGIVRAGQAPRSVLPAGVFGCLHIYLPARVVDGAAERVTGRSAPVELIDPAHVFDPQLWRIGQAIIGSISQGQNASSLQFEGLAQALTAHLIGAWSSAGDRHRRPSNEQGRGLAAWQVRLLTDRPAADLTAEPSLEELAVLADRSAAHVCRAFATATGLPPHRWLLARRIERARDLLSNSDLPVAEIAAAVGYDDPSYFARLFKRRTGVTPQAWRRERS